MIDDIEFIDTRAAGARRADTDPEVCYIRHLWAVTHNEEVEVKNESESDARTEFQLLIKSVLHGRKLLRKIKNRIEYCNGALACKNESVNELHPLVNSIMKKIGDGKLKRFSIDDGAQEGALKMLEVRWEDLLMSHECAEDSISDLEVSVDSRYTEFLDNSKLIESSFSSLPLVFSKYALMQRKVEALRTRVRLAEEEERRLGKELALEIERTLANLHF